MFADLPSVRSSIPTGFGAWSLGFRTWMAPAGLQKLGCGWGLGVRSYTQDPHNLFAAFGTSLGGLRVVRFAHGRATLNTHTVTGLVAYACAVTRRIRVVAPGCGVLGGVNVRVATFNHEVAAFKTTEKNRWPASPGEVCGFLVVFEVFLKRLRRKTVKNHRKTRLACASFYRIFKPVNPFFEGDLQQILLGFACGICRILLIQKRTSFACRILQIYCRIGLWAGVFWKSWWLPTFSKYPAARGLKYRFFVIYCGELWGLMNEVLSIPYVQ